MKKHIVKQVVAMLTCGTVLLVSLAGCGNQGSDNASNSETVSPSDSAAANIDPHSSPETVVLAYANMMIKECGTDAQSMEETVREIVPEEVIDAQYPEDGEDSLSNTIRTSAERNQKLLNGVNELTNNDWDCTFEITDTIQVSTDLAELYNDRYHEDNIYLQWTVSYLYDDSSFNDDFRFWHSSGIPRYTFSDSYYADLGLEIEEWQWVALNVNRFSFVNEEDTTPIVYMTVKIDGKWYLDIAGTGRQLGKIDLNLYYILPDQFWMDHSSELAEYL